MAAPRKGWRRCSPVTWPQKRARADEPAIPYQPSLLRLLHGVTALLVPLAWLSGWVVLIISGAVIWHVVDVVRRGGLPLAGSMLKLTLRDSDRPRHWPKQLLQRR